MYIYIYIYVYIYICDDIPDKLTDYIPSPSLLVRPKSMKFGFNLSITYSVVTVKQIMGEGFSYPNKYLKELTSFYPFRLFF